jgi:hypothetical protein
VKVALIPFFILAPTQTFGNEKSLLEAAVIGGAEGLILGLAAVFYYFIWIPVRKRLSIKRDKKLILENELNPLMIAAADGNDDEIEKLLSQGFDVNIAGKLGLTALMLAARNDKRSTARLLIKNGANVFAKTEKGNDARDIARKYKHLEMSSILSEYMDE